MLAIVGGACLVLLGLVFVFDARVAALRRMLARSLFGKSWLSSRRLIEIDTRVRGVVLVIVGVLLIAWGLRRAVALAAAGASALSVAGLQG